METLEEIRQRLESHFTQYRTIWVQGHARAGQRDVLITLFTQYGYEMITMRNLSMVSYEEIFTRLQREVNIVEILN